MTEVSNTTSEQDTEESGLLSICQYQLGGYSHSKVVSECIEVEETQYVQTFVSKSCGCVLHNGRSCSEQFSIDHYLQIRSQCKELTRAELDMALLGQLSAFCFSGEQTVRATSQRHPSEARQHTYTMFWHKGVKVCRKTFLFLHTCSEKRLKAAFSKMAYHPVCTATLKGSLPTLPVLLTSNM